MPKKKRSRILATRLQIFAAIAWFVMCAMLTINFSDIKNYLLGISIVTGVCLLAWGIPFGSGVIYRFFTGQPVQPFKIDAPRRRTKDKKA
jgi:hypothetical protein